MVSPASRSRRTAPRTPSSGSRSCSRGPSRRVGRHDHALRDRAPRRRERPGRRPGSAAHRPGGLRRASSARWTRRARSATSSGWSILARFGERFAGLLVHEYGHVMQRPSQLRRHAPPRQSPAPAGAAAHRARVQLARRSGPAADPVPGRLPRAGGDLPRPGANPLTFTTDTIETNCVEYLVEQGFDVWVQEWRGSTLLPTCRGSFNADQVARWITPPPSTTCERRPGATTCTGSRTASARPRSPWRRWPAPSRRRRSCLERGDAPHRADDHEAQGRLQRRLAAPTPRRALMTTDAYDEESLGAKAFDQLLRLYPIPEMRALRPGRVPPAGVHLRQRRSTTRGRTRAPTSPCTSCSAPPTCR